MTVCLLNLFGIRLIAVVKHTVVVDVRERVEMLGGKLIVESAPGKGTMISAEVPCGDASIDRR